MTQTAAPSVAEFDFVDVRFVNRKPVVTVPVDYTICEPVSTAATPIN